MTTAVITVNGVPGMLRIFRPLMALAVLAGVTLTPGGALAQTENVDGAESPVCVTVDFSGARMVVGAIDRTEARAVDLPAGVVSIPSARATDTYPWRDTVTQNSERYEVEFLAADGRIIATSAPTGDVPDMVVFGEWIGDLGSVTLPEPAVAVRAHHRPDLPGDDTPQSVLANELTLCSGEPTPPPVCGDPGVTTKPDGTPCDPPPVCGDPGVTTKPDGTPCDPPSIVTTIPNDSTTTSETTPTSEDVAGVTTTTAAPAETTTTTAPASTSTTAGEEVAGPDAELPVTGSSTPLLLTIGGLLVLAGGGLILLRRQAVS